MRVKRAARKDATLLMLHHRKLKYECGEAGTPDVTAYTVARWNGIPQSQAWGILSELCFEGYVKRSEKNGKKVIIWYALSQLGRTYVENNVIGCTHAQNQVYDWLVCQLRKAFKK